MAEFPPPVHISLPGEGSCWSLACGVDGRIYVTRREYIYVVDEDGGVQCYAGSGTGNKLGHRLEAKFTEPHGLCWAESEILYFSDRESHQIKCILADEVELVAGSGIEGRLDGPAAKAQFSRPYGVTELNGAVYVTDWSDTIRVIADGKVTTIGTGQLKSLDGSFSSACFHFPTGITPGLDNTILVSESTGCSIRVLNLTDQTASKLVGRNGEKIADGPMATAALGLARGLVCLPNGDIYFCDRGSHMIRRISGGYVKSILAISDANSSSRNSIIPDNPHYPYTTSFPSALAFTPDGALWWVETAGVVCSIPDVIPPFGIAKLPALPSFLALCDAPDLFPTDWTLQLCHTAPTPTLSLHTYVIALNPDISPKKLEIALRTSRQAKHAQLLQHILYGVASVISEADSLTTLLELLELVVDCGITNIATWLLHGIYLSKSASKNRDMILAYQKNLPEGHEAGKDLTDLLAALARRIAPSMPAPSEIDATVQQGAITTDIGSSNSKSRFSGKSSIPTPPSILNSAISLKSLVRGKSANRGDELNFTISVEPSAGKGVSFVVPTWILYCRWTYFQRMMATGLCEEMTARVLDLPSDFPIALLHPLLWYICTGIVDIEGVKEDDAIGFVFTNGAEYNLMDLNREPLPQFKPFVEACKKRLFAAPAHGDYDLLERRIKAYGTPEMMEEFTRSRTAAKELQEISAFGEE